MSADITEFDLSNFDAETQKGLVMAFFWEPWDSGSRRESRIIEKVAALMEGKLKVGMCNIEKAPQLAQRLNIRSIPATILFRDGKEAERFVGLRHEGTLIRHLKKYLAQES